jgi:hypothetical protein
VLLVARNSILRRRSKAPDGTQDTEPAVDPGTERVVDNGDPTGAADEPGGTEPAGQPVTYPGRGWIRVSTWATLGLILSLVGLCATLTGPLAPEGFVLAVLGVLACLGGIVAGRRPGVVGRGVAGLGLILGLVGIGLAIAALSGRFSWPNSRTDEVAHWHAWLVAHWSWLGRW